MRVRCADRMCTPPEALPELPLRLWMSLFPTLRHQGTNVSTLASDDWNIIPLIQGPNSRSPPLDFTNAPFYVMMVILRSKGRPRSLTLLVML